MELCHKCKLSQNAFLKCFVKRIQCSLAEGSLVDSPSLASGEAPVCRSIVKELSFNAPGNQLSQRSSTWTRPAALTQILRN